MVHVVAHVRHTVEVNHVVHAVVDDVKYNIAVARCQTAVYLMHLPVVFQIIRHLVGSAKVFTLFREVRIWSKVEISFHKESRLSRHLHLIVYIEIIFRTAHKHYMPDSVFAQSYLFYYISQCESHRYRTKSHHRVEQ